MMIGDKTEKFREGGYSFAYGYLCGAVEVYLFGNGSRELLEQQFRAIEDAIKNQTNSARKVDQ
jgi:hypothetical protein